MDSSPDSCVADPSDGGAAAAVPSRSPTPPPLARLPSTGSAVLDEAESLAAARSAAGFPQKLPSSRYKGVVPQPNGRWGAQIYERHQRVWLGTFASESEAAKSYDAAAQRFRGRDAVTNFRPLADAAAAGDAEAEAEMRFLSSKSKAEIVDMLRKHTYADEFAHSKRFGAAAAGGGAAAHRAASAAAAREHLFDKAVTPSDVGKLNRLVIPKQHAEKHFPLPPGGAADDSAAGAGAGAGETKGVLLNFEDAAGKVWRFRYSYWNSSQSYVLTKGWSRFVKEKALSAGDVVGFYRSCGPEKQLFIDCKPRAAASLFKEAAPAKPAVRLFGVDLTLVPAMSPAAAGGKRSAAAAAVGSLELTLMKKQCIAGIV